MLVLDFAEADTVESLVETGSDGARLAVLGHDIFLTGVEVVDLANGGSYSGGAHSGSLVDCLKLLDGDVAAAGLFCPILWQLPGGIGGDRREG